MTLFYAGDITKLSDDELKLFKSEIEDAGALSVENIDYYDEADWLRQAHDRYWDLDKEQKRRLEELNPEVAERERKRRKPMMDMVAMASQRWHLARLEKMYSDSDAIAALIRKQ